MDPKQTNSNMESVPDNNVNVDLSEQSPVKFETYTPSGKVSPVTILLSLLWGIPVIGVAAICYFMVSDIRDNFILPAFLVYPILACVLGLGIGGIMGTVLKRGNCRNPGLTFLMVFVLPSLGWIFSDSIVYLIFHAYTYWGIQTEFFGYLFWLLPLNAGALYCVDHLIEMNKPFCENCKQWSNEQELGQVYGINKESLSSAIREKNLVPLLSVDKLPKGGEAVEYNLYTCPNCQKDKFVSIDWVVNPQKKDLNQSLVKFIKVSDEQLEHLTNRIHELQSSRKSQ